jgi:hypothetical protein
MEFKHGFHSEVLFINIIIDICHIHSPNVVDKQKNLYDKEVIPTKETCSNKILPIKSGSRGASDR